MKYSITGTFINLAEADLYAVTDNYPVRKLDLLYLQTAEDRIEAKFEIWVGTQNIKTALFDDFKPLIVSYSGFMSWHMCYHDEIPPKPCGDRQDIYGTQ